MRKSSKVISLALSGLMATSCFSMVAASAAQVDADSTGVMTAAERQAAGHQLVFFRFPSSAWGNNAKVKYNAKKHTCNVFCNYYAIYGNKGEVKDKFWATGGRNEDNTILLSVERIEGSEMASEWRPEGPYGP